MSNSIKLNIGCASRPLSGYVNIDLDTLEEIKEGAAVSAQSKMQAVVSALANVSGVKLRRTAHSLSL